MLRGQLLAFHAPTAQSQVTIHVFPSFPRRRESLLVSLNPRAIPAFAGMTDTEQRANVAPLVPDTSALLGSLPLQRHPPAPL